MASLLLETTVGGYGVIHSNNIGSQSVSVARQLLSPNDATVVAADSAMPSAGHSFIHTLALGPGGNDGHILGMSWAGTTSIYGAQIFLDTDPNDIMAIRSRSNAGVWTSWKTVWHSGNLTNLNQLTNGPGYITSVGNITRLWAESHPDDYYVRANWTGSYWQLTSNHPSPVQVGYADNAGALSGLGVGSFLRDDGWNNSPGQDANTQEQMRVDFTYSNNAPYTGELIRFGSSGYSTQFNTSYGNSDNFAFRTRNGDNGAWNPWRAVIHTGNIASQSVSNADTVDGFHASVAGTANTIPTRNANGYLIPENWIQLNGIYGLYSPTNSAHLRPNDGSYGSWLVTGSRNGWRGLEFDSGSNGNVSLMVSASSNTTGFHNNSYGWQFYWEGGTLYCSKNAYGAGTNATVLDSVNFTSYAPSLTGGGASGSWGISVTGTAGSAPNAGNINPFYNVTAGIGNGLRFWAGDDNYKISMGVGGLYQYGPVSDYSIKSQMDAGSTGRGFTWGNNGVTPVAALNATSGNFQVAGTIANGSIWINNGANYNDYNENIRLFDAPNGVSVIAFSASGTGGSPRTSLLGFSDRLETRVSDTWEQRIYGGYVEARGSFRAPIFYDSNDTSYYGDFAGFSRMSEIGVTNDYVYNYDSIESPRSVAEFGNVGKYVATRNAVGDYPSFSFEHVYGTHSWGQIARFHIRQSGADRPSIQFSSGSSNTRWNIGYCTGSDDNFRIVQNMGYRPDNSGVTDSWGTERFRINTDGSMYCLSSFTASGDVTAYSDIRVKENIEVIPDAIKKVKSIRGVTFTRTDNDDNKKYMGVIAQELLDVIPEVVSETDSGMYTVAYGNITALLIEAIKEQQAQIDELKAKLDGLTK